MKLATIIIAGLIYGEMSSFHDLRGKCYVKLIETFVIGKTHVFQSFLYKFTQNIELYLQHDILTLLCYILSLYMLYYSSFTNILSSCISDC